MAHGEAAAAAAIANAIKASGAVVRVAPNDFVTILRKADKPLVIYHKGGFISIRHEYLTSYKGFVFFTKSAMEIDFMRSVEVIIAERIWVPG